METTKRHCVGCGSPFLTRRPSKTYCSSVCRGEFERRQNKERNPRGPLTTGTMGAIGELVVATDLMRKGYNVFRALSPSCPCDLAILKDQQLLQVEVRTGYYRRNGKVTFPTKGTIRADVLAIVLPTEIIYRGLPSPTEEAKS